MCIQLFPQADADILCHFWFYLQPNAKSAAQRNREWRERKKAEDPEAWKAKSRQRWHSRVAAGNTGCLDDIEERRAQGRHWYKTSKEKA